ASPSRLPGQPAFGQAAPGVRLVPVDECDRRVRSQRLDPAEAAPMPDAAVLREPVGGPLGTCALAPKPTFDAPKFFRAITVGFHKSCEFGIRDRGLGNAERRNLGLMRPFLIVE